MGIEDIGQRLVLEVLLYIVLSRILLPNASALNIYVGYLVVWVLSLGRCSFWRYFRYNVPVTLYCLEFYCLMLLPRAPPLITDLSLLVRPIKSSWTAPCLLHFCSLYRGLFVFVFVFVSVFAFVFAPVTSYFPNHIDHDDCSHHDQHDCQLLNQHEYCHQDQYD